VIKTPAWRIEDEGDRVDSIVPAGTAGGRHLESISKIRGTS